jgi:hypothetical protein
VGPGVGLDDVEKKTTSVFAGNLNTFHDFSSRSLDTTLTELQDENNFDERRVKGEIKIRKICPTIQNIRNEGNFLQYV